MAASKITGHDRIENWKPVSGYPDYLISDHGRVMRVRGTHKSQPGDILAYSMVSGYRKVNLWNDGICKMLCVHRLVCDAFNGPPPPNVTVCRHLDGDPLNNDPKNLAWGTHQDNSDDKARHGRVLKGDLHPLRINPSKAARGSRVQQAKIDEDMARQIKSWKGRCTSTHCATNLGVSPHIVRKIWSGLTWRHI